MVERESGRERVIERGEGEGEGRESERVRAREGERERKPARVREGETEKVDGGRERNGLSKLREVEQ